MSFMEVCSCTYLRTLNIVNPKPINDMDVRTPASMVRSAASNCPFNSKLVGQFQFLPDFVLLFRSCPTFFGVRQFPPSVPSSSATVLPAYFHERRGLWSSPTGPSVFDSQF